MRVRTWPRGLFVAWLAFVLVLTVVIYAGARSSSRPASDTFWHTAYSVDGIEAEQYDTMAGMSRAADLVVVGSIERVAKGREFVANAEAASRTDDPYRKHAIAYYAVADLRISKVLAGNAVAGDVVQLEIFASQWQKLDALVGSPALDSGLFFLRNKGIEAARLSLPASTQAADKPFYRLVNRDGLLRRFDGKAAIPPDSEAAFLRPFEGMNFDAVTDLVRKSL